MPRGCRAVLSAHMDHGVGIHTGVGNATGMAWTVATAESTAARIVDFILFTPGLDTRTHTYFRFPVLPQKKRAYNQDIYTAPDPFPDPYHPSALVLQPHRRHQKPGNSLSSAAVVFW